MNFKVAIHFTYFFVKYWYIQRCLLAANQYTFTCMSPHFKWFNERFFKILCQECKKTKTWKKHEGPLRNVIWNGNQPSPVTKVFYKTHSAIFFFLITIGLWACKLYCLRQGHATGLNSSRHGVGAQHVFIEWMKNCHQGRSLACLCLLLQVGTPFAGGNCPSWRRQEILTSEVMALPALSPPLYFVYVTPFKMSPCRNPLTMSLTQKCHSKL